ALDGIAQAPQDVTRRIARWQVGQGGISRRAPAAIVVTTASTTRPRTRRPTSWGACAIPSKARARNVGIARVNVRSEEPRVGKRGCSPRGAVGGGAATAPRGGPPPLGGGGGGGGGPPPRRPGAPRGPPPLPPPPPPPPAHILGRLRDPIQGAGPQRRHRPGQR